MAQFPNTDTADGIWTLKKVRRAILGGNWPLPLEPELLVSLRGTDIAPDFASNVYLVERSGSSVPAIAMQRSSSVRFYTPANDDWAAVTSIGDINEVNASASTVSPLGASGVGDIKKSVHWTNYTSNTNTRPVGIASIDSSNTVSTSSDDTLSVRYAHGIVGPENWWVIAHKDQTGDLSGVGGQPTMIQGSLNGAVPVFDWTSEDSYNTHPGYYRAIYLGNDPSNPEDLYYHTFWGNWSTQYTSSIDKFTFSAGGTITGTRVSNWTTASLISGNDSSFNTISGAKINRGVWPHAFSTTMQTAGSPRTFYNDLTSPTADGKGNQVLGTNGGEIAAICAIRIQGSLVKCVWVEVGQNSIYVGTYDPSTNTLTSSQVFASNTTTPQYTHGIVYWPDQRLCFVCSQSDRAIDILRV